MRLQKINNIQYKAIYPGEGRENGWVAQHAVFTDRYCWDWVDDEGGHSEGCYATAAECEADNASR